MVISDHIMRLQATERAAALRGAAAAQRSPSSTGRRRSWRPGLRRRRAYRSRIVGLRGTAE